MWKQSQHVWPVGLQSIRSGLPESCMQQQSSSAQPAVDAAQLSIPAALLRTCLSKGLVEVLDEKCVACRAHNGAAPDHVRGAVHQHSDQPARDLETDVGACWTRLITWNNIRKKCIVYMDGIDRRVSGKCR